MDLQIQEQQLRYNIWYSLTDLEKLRIFWNSKEFHLTTNKAYVHSLTSDHTKSSYYYTLVIHNVNTTFVNTVITNIPDNDIVKGNIVVPYVLPNPPNGRYTYRITIFAQSSVIKNNQSSWLSSGFDLDSLLDRKTTSVMQMISYYKLNLLSNETLLVDGDAKLFYRSRTSEIEGESVNADIEKLISLQSFESLGIGGLDQRSAVDQIFDLIS
ncbi:Hypothetical protein HVR_LOCUS838 [uncultured virus]|nr:Hypothetical protein HVR_LOCUS838 [uncultured virus]